MRRWRRVEGRITGVGRSQPLIPARPRDARSCAKHRPSSASRFASGLTGRLCYASHAASWPSSRTPPRLRNSILASGGMWCNCPSILMVRRIDEARTSLAMDGGDAEIAHNIRAPTPRLAVPSARPRPEVDRPPVTELKAASAAGGHDNSSNSVFASFRSGASKPSVNQCRSGRAGLLRCACPVSARAGPEGGAQFEEGALCRRATERAR